jgi:GNAT superfamily N-acetyltransferase
VDVTALLAAYDEFRDRLPDPGECERAERDGPLVRMAGWRRGGFIQYRDLGGLQGAALDELIARQVAFFRERGESFEWKTHGHDLPADLPERLHAVGFVTEPEETVLLAPSSAIAAEASLPPGVEVREVSKDADFERIAEMERRVWGDQHTHGLVQMLAGRRALDPRAQSVYVAQVEGEVISAAWVRFPAESSFATLHGGATLPAWRRRGVYRALVATRAALAVERGYPYLQVDASDDSRPILERLGFAAATTTTPFIWAPPQSS